MVSCCSHKKQEKTCKRKSDGKVFNLPRRFSRKKCMGKIKGFTMRSSCAPYLECKKNKNKTKNKLSNKARNNNIYNIYMRGGTRPSMYPSLSNMLIEPYAPNYPQSDLTNLRVEPYSSMTNASPFIGGGNSRGNSGGNSRSKHMAVSLLSPNKNGITGTVLFTETQSGLKINYDINGLSDGKHGFHIHEYGDLTDGCKSACAHFNPFGKTHGGLNSEERHAGDLGNIISKNGKSKGSIIDKVLSLDFKKETCIVGRMIIVHKDEDDLGLGGNAESLKTGNAGERVACGVIGLKGICE